MVKVTILRALSCLLHRQILLAIIMCSDATQLWVIALFRAALMSHSSGIQMMQAEPFFEFILKEIGKPVLVHARDNNDNRRGNMAISTC